MSDARSAPAKKSNLAEIARQLRKQDNVKQALRLIPEKANVQGGDAQRSNRPATGKRGNIYTLIGKARDNQRKTRDQNQKQRPAGVQSAYAEQARLNQHQAMLHAAQQAPGARTLSPEIAAEHDALIAWAMHKQGIPSPTSYAAFLKNAEIQALNGLQIQGLLDMPHGVAYQQDTAWARAPGKPAIGAKRWASRQAAYLSPGHRYGLIRAFENVYNAMLRVNKEHINDNDLGGVRPKSVKEYHDAMSRLCSALVTGSERNYAEMHDTMHKKQTLRKEINKVNHQASSIAFFIALVTPVNDPHFVQLTKDLAQIKYRYIPAEQIEFRPQAAVDFGLDPIAKRNLSRRAKAAWAWMNWRDNPVDDSVDPTQPPGRPRRASATFAQYRHTTASTALRVFPESFRQFGSDVAGITYYVRNPVTLGKKTANALGEAARKTASGFVDSYHSQQNWRGDYEVRLLAKNNDAADNMLTKRQVTEWEAAVFRLIGEYRQMAESGIRDIRHYKLPPAFMTSLKRTLLESQMAHGGLTQEEVNQAVANPSAPWYSPPAEGSDAGSADIRFQFMITLLRGIITVEVERSYEKQEFPTIDEEKAAEMTNAQQIMKSFGRAVSRTSEVTGRMRTGATSRTEFVPQRPSRNAPRPRSAPPTVPSSAVAFSSTGRAHMLRHLMSG